jgi:hypothetical protein
MKILRIFLKGLNGNYCESPISDNAGMQEIMNTFKSDGVIHAEPLGMAPWAVPWDGWAFMCIVTVADNAPQPARSPLAWDIKPPEPQKPN